MSILANPQIPDIGAIGPLTPRKIMSPNGDGEWLVNVDGVIALMRNGDTDKSRRAYRAFRKEFSRLRRADPDVGDEKRKVAAVMVAIQQVGGRLVQA